jgi:hypothetical protein
MIVYFSGSARNIKKDIVIYRRILNAVRSLGHIVARDWVETAWAQEMRDSSKKHIEQIDWSIVAETDAAIESAEIFIAEASNSSTFGVGYEVAVALSRRKPILLLVREEDAPLSYASGIKNELVTYQKYNDNNLEKLVEAFAEENTIKTKDLRFNFVIDRQIHNHLKVRSFKSGKTKAEVVRDLLLKDMEGHDK